MRSDCHRGKLASVRIPCVDRGDEQGLSYQDWNDGLPEEEVVSVAGDQKQAMFAGVTEYLDVAGSNRQNLSQFSHLVAFLA
jgi:hypothetical protein